MPWRGTDAARHVRRSMTCAWDSRWLERRATPRSLVRVAGRLLAMDGDDQLAAEARAVRAQLCATLPEAPLRAPVLDA